MQNSLFHDLSQTFREIKQTDILLPKVNWLKSIWGRVCSKKTDVSCTKFQMVSTVIFVSKLTKYCLPEMLSFKYDSGLGIQKLNGKAVS